MRSTPSSSTVRNASRRSRRSRAPARRSVPVPRRRPATATIVLRGIGAAVLVSGWLAASAVAMQASETPDADAVEYQIVENGVYPITLAESKREQQLVRRMDGDLGLWFAEFDVGLRSLLRPPRLAWTLLILSTAIGVACLELAKLSAEDDE
jgi:hypothetical protein